MAKRPTRTVDLTLSDFDFNDGLDFPDFNFDPPPVTNKREAVERIATNARDSFVSSLTSPTFFQTLVRKALPKGFGQMLDLVDNGAVTLRDLYNDGEKQLKPAIQDLARTTERLVPAAEKYLPKKFTDKLKGFSERHRGSDSYSMHQVSAEAAENLAVAGLLADVFKYNAETDAKREVRRGVQEQLRDNIERDRHGEQLNQLDSIRSSVFQMAAYQRKVEFNYHRKSLELQARSYFVAMETLREQKRQNAFTSAHLVGILKNTSLPDYVKMTTSEQFMQLTSNKFLDSTINAATRGGGGMMGGLFGRRANFLQHMGDAVREQGRHSLTNAASGFRSGLAGVNAGLDHATDDSGGVDKYAAGGHMLGAFLSNLFRDKVASRFSQHTQHSNNKWIKQLRRVGNNLQYRAENAPQLIGEFANNVTPAEDYAGNIIDRINNRFGDPISSKWERRIKGAVGAVGNPALNFARDTTRRAQNMDTQIREGNFTGLTEPSVFTNHTQRAITEVIPGLLSRLWQEVHILRTGKPNADMLTYNYQTNRFDMSKSVKDSVYGKFINKQATESTQRELDEVFKLIDPDGTKLTAEQRRILGARMMQDNLTGAVGRAGDLGRYSNKSQFNGSDAERANAKAFADLFKNFKNGDADGANQVKFADLFSKIGQAHENPYAYIQQLVSTGHRAQLEEMGILAPGSTKINMDRVLAYQSGSMKYHARGTRALTGRNVMPLNNPLPPTLPPSDPAPLPVPQGADPNLPIVRQGFDMEPLQNRLQAMHELIEKQNTLPILGDIHTTLQAMQARLDEGILTVPMSEVLEQLLRNGGGQGGNQGGNGRRGIIRRLGGFMNTSLKDLVKGSFKLAGKTLRAGAWVGNKLVNTGFSALKGVAGLAGDVASGVAGGAYRRARGFIDIYVGNERKPRMYGRQLQEGNVYFDKATNKPIRKFSDITGTVVKRQNGQETVVLEEEEIEHAWQREGAVKKSLKSLGALAKAGKKIGEGIFNVVTSGLPLVYRAAFTVAKKAYGLLDMPQDVYVKDGGPDPVLLARIMRRGGYRSATTGETITRPSQIDGPVLVSSADGDEVALSHDDIRKGLVDKNGQPLRTGLAKLANLAVGALKGAFGAAKWLGNKAWNGVKGLAKNAWGLTKGIVKTGVKTLGFGLDVIRGKPWFEGADELRYSLQIGVQSHAVLEQIRDLLDARLPERKRKVNGDADGDGVRDGSYQDLREKLKEKTERKALEDSSKAGTAGVGGGGMLASMKAMWDKMRGKKDEEEDDDGGIDVDIGGDGEGRDNSRDARRKRRLKRMRNRGVWGKTKALARGAGKFALGAGSALAGLAGVSLGGIASVGGAIASGVGAAASGIAAGAGALAAGIGSVISAPVLLGAAAVAAVGVGAYYGYKYLTRYKLGLLSRVRYVQYGFSPTDDSHVNAVFALEDKLRPAITYGREGAKLDPSKIDILKLLELFDISKDDKREIENWANWFGDRFKPVFLTHVTALRAVAGDKTLADVDKLEPAVQKKYLDLVKFPEGQYNATTSPFKDLKTLPSMAGDVRAIIEIVETELIAKLKNAPLDKSAAAGVGVAATAASVSALDASKPKVVQGAQPTTTAVQKAVSGMAASAALTGKAPATVTIAGSSVVLDSLGVNKIDNLSAVRYRTYGLVKMEADKVRALRTLEKTVSRDLIFNKKVASWNGALEEVLKSSASSFAIDITNEEQNKAWLAWFNGRFLPAFLNYATAVNAITGKVDLEHASGLLSPTQQVDVATSIYTTISNVAGSSSVWTLASSPWQGYALNTDTKSVEGNMQSLKEVAKNAILPEPTTKSANQPTAKSVTGSSTETAAATSGGIRGWFGSMADKVTGFFKGSTSTTEAGVATGSKAPMESHDPARLIQQPGKGTGGDINAIPLPKGNKSWAALKDTILAAAQMAGVDPKLMAAMAAIESGFNYQARAGTSSASGLYQFIDSTWKWMIKRHGAKYGISPNTSQLDPRANALLGAEYLKENIAVLQSSVNRPLTDTDLYFAHFLGSGGAKNFLKADPNALGANLFPKEAKANKNIFFAKDGTPLTVGQIYNKVNSLVKNKGAKLGVGIAGEDMVESSPSTPKPPAVTGAGSESAKTATAEKPIAVVNVSAPRPTSNGIGAPSSPQTATTPTSATSTPSPSNIAGVEGLTGFAGMAAAPMRDIAQQAKYQQEMKVVGMEAANETLNKSLGVQNKILEAMGELVKLARTPRPQSTPSSSPQPQAVAQAPQRQQAEMRRSPVSMAKPSESY